MREYFNPVLDVLNYQLFAFGKAEITPMTLISFLALSALLIFVSGKLKQLLVTRFLARPPLKHGARQAIGTITRYLVLFIGFVVILQTVGIDLTAFNVLAGAIGIGIGLGLQNIATNFISGLILLIERPIQIGDRIEIGGVNGEVVSIGPRSTHFRTNDNITMIVPNSKFIAENVVNWSYKSNLIRFRIPALVTHDSDTEIVVRLMNDAALENPDVAEEPPPSVRFINFDEDGLHFELRAWSTERLHRPGLFKSDLNTAVIEKFRKHHVQVVKTKSDKKKKAEKRARSNGHAPKNSTAKKQDSAGVRP